MQGPLGKPQLPHCRDCGAGSPHVVSYQVRVGMGGVTEYRHVWLCAGCEFKRAHPDAVIGTSLPRELRPLPLQRETLFGDAA